MTRLECRQCGHLACEAPILMFYQQSSKSFHLVVKPEKRNELVANLIIRSTENPKAKKIKPNEIFCYKCENKIGTEILIGPNAEGVICMRAESIKLRESTGQELVFDGPAKWNEKRSLLPNIEFRDLNTFYGFTYQNSPEVDESKFEPTSNPTIDEIYAFNIGELIADVPRSYQVELYVASLLANTICYLPTGSGKTLVAAMLAAFMLKKNPRKKIFFVTDRVPLVFQQASYLRYQTSLRVGEFCGENRELFQSQLDSDILVFTADFLYNKLFTKTLFIQNCSLLIIDEVHHAISEHSFRRLVQDFYHKAAPANRPRILGLSASPSSAQKECKIYDDLANLSKLIEGRVYMPRIYAYDLNRIVNRPDMRFELLNRFIEAQSHPMEASFVQALDRFMQPLLQHLGNSHIGLSLDNTKPHLFNALRKFLKLSVNEAMLKREQKRGVIARFLQNISNSVEVMSVLGLTDAANFVLASLQKQIADNQKNKMWRDSEIGAMRELALLVKNFSGISGKSAALIDLLRDTSVQNRRSIVFVRSRKTARFLVEFLCKDAEIRTRWNPEIFVGHAGGSHEGMDWREEQEPALSRFSSGTTKLLVSTSVLQEGLDVPVCDTVIMFDRMWSSTEYVQSRGRARDSNSQFVVIGSPGERNFYTNLVACEQRVGAVIGGQSTIAANQRLLVSQARVERLNALIQSTDRKHTILNKASASSKSSLELTLQFYVEPFDEEKLLTTLKQIRELVQVEPSGDSFVAVELFEEAQRVFNASFSFRGAETNATKTLLDFFAPVLRQTNCASYLFREKSPLAQGNIQVMCQQVRFGNLTSVFDFAEFDRLAFGEIREIKVIFEYNEKLLQVLFDLNDRWLKIEAAFDSIDQLIRVDVERSWLEVFVPCKRPPFVYRAAKSDKANSLKTIDEKYLDWQRSCDFHAGWTLKLKFGAEERLAALAAFQIIPASRILFGPVAKRSASYTLSDAKSDFVSNEFSSRYALEAFLSQNFHLLIGKIDRHFVASLNSLEADRMNRVLERMTLHLASNKRFHSLNELLSSVLSDDRESVFEMVLKNLKTVLIRRVVVTPLRVIYFFPEPNFSNRVIRRFDPRQFLRVRFRDEDQRKLNYGQRVADMSSVYSQIASLLKAGLVVAGRRFEFLAMSASQLREHGCWLFHGEADCVRSWMGDFSDIKCIGKYTARLGQSLSSSVETFQALNVETIPDVEVGGTTCDGQPVKYCFTDGIGKISFEKAMEVCQKYYDIKYASAFQIRYGGFKGVVAVDHRLLHAPLQFRPSMKKFDSGHDRLDVLNS